MIQIINAAGPGQLAEELVAKIMAHGTRHRLGVGGRISSDGSNVIFQRIGSITRAIATDSAAGWMIVIDTRNAAGGVPVDYYFYVVATGESYFLGQNDYGGGNGITYRDGEAFAVSVNFGPNVVVDVYLASDEGPVYQWTASFNSDYRLQSVAPDGSAIVIQETTFFFGAPTIIYRDGDEFEVPLTTAVSTTATIVSSSAVSVGRYYQETLPSDDDDETVDYRFWNDLTIYFPNSSIYFSDTYMYAASPNGNFLLLWDVGNNQAGRFFMYDLARGVTLYSLPHATFFALVVTNSGELFYSYATFDTNILWFVDASGVTSKHRTYNAPVVTVNTEGFVALGTDYGDARLGNGRSLGYWWPSTFLNKVRTE